MDAGFVIESSLHKSLNSSLYNDIAGQQLYNMFIVMRYRLLKLHPYI